MALYDRMSHEAAEGRKGRKARNRRTRARGRGDAIVLAALFGGILALGVLGADLGSAYLSSGKPLPAAVELRADGAELRMPPASVAGLSPEAFRNLLTVSALGAIVLGLRRL